MKGFSRVLSYRDQGCKYLCTVCVHLNLVFKYSDERKGKDRFSDLMVRKRNICFIKKNYHVISEIQDSLEIRAVTVF